ncbi:MAG: C40 family peptidase [Bacteroidales bacterium]
MTTHKAAYTGFILVALIFMFSSCGTSRQANKKITYLSQQTGIQLNKHDNLKLYEECVKWIGTPHCSRSNNKNCFDCSGFVVQVYTTVFGKNIGRSSQEMMTEYCHKKNKRSLKEGDLVFFNTSNKPKSKNANHVGIYLKEGAFIHTSTSKGVMISNLSEPYYLKTWLSGGKVK